VCRDFGTDGTAVSSDPMYGTLYIVATPIGNLDDITLRAIDTLRKVSTVAAEDTRRTRTLLSHLDIKTKIISYHQHNEARRAPSLIADIKDGQDIALVTDAGTPGISDPGRVIINMAFEQGVDVVPIPGASAVTATLSVCPFLYDRYLFYGFLPAKRTVRKKSLDKLRGYDMPVVFFISPHKLSETIEDIYEIFGNRRVFLAKEITKIYESFQLDTLANILSAIRENRTNIRGEFTLVLEGDARTDNTKTDTISNPDLDMHTLTKKLQSKGLSKKDTVDVLSTIFKLSKKELYKSLIDNQ